VSMSGGSPEAVSGLGLLSGSLSVHLDGEAERLPTYRAAISAGELPPGYAADDGAALLYRGTRLTMCVASRPGARVVHIGCDGRGELHESDLPVTLLPGAEAGPLFRREPYGVSELRALRAGRHRWD